MEISASAINTYQLGPSGAMTFARLTERPESRQPLPTGDEELLREKFQEFVAGTFFRLWMNALRKSQAENTLYNGGKAEKIFTAQLDQTLADRFANSHGHDLVGSMFDQWLNRIGSQTNNTGKGADTDELRNLGTAPL